MKGILTRIFWLSLLLCGIAPVFRGAVLAQNAPVTTINSVLSAVPGQPVQVPVSVTGFSNIGSFTLTMDYDYTRLQYVSGALNPLVVGNLSIGDNDMGNGVHRLVIGWFGGCSGIPDNAALVTYTFNYSGGNTNLQWFEIGPSCEYSDLNANVLTDSPIATYYINGMVCSALPTPGPISGPSSLCQGVALTSYSITPLSGISSYNWTVPPGATIVSGFNSNTIEVEYQPTSSSGNVTVCGIGECGNGPLSILPVTVNSLPVANAGNDTTIGYGTSTQLHALSGGSGSFSYHWTPAELLVNPNVQNPVTIQLLSTELFHLTVTNTASNCQSTDEIIVNISGGPLSVNPVALPDLICQGQSSQLYANPSGGSGIYNYVWTCFPVGTPAWSSTQQNPVVDPDTTTQYLLSVFDGFNAVNGTATITVDPLPTAYVNGGGVICDDGSTVPVQIQLTGTPPWSFIYSDGSNTYPVSNQMTTPFIIETSHAGTYTVISLNDQNCSGNSSGSANVEVTPLPSTPNIILQDSILVSDAPEGNQWYVNGDVILGATASTYQPLESGQYCSIVTLNDCSSDSSNRIDYVITGMPDQEFYEIELTPNPAVNFFTLKMKKYLEGTSKISIFSADGFRIKIFEIPSTFLQFGYSFDISYLSSGLYFISISTGERNSLKKLLVL
ncbi:MAG: T9SS type A sorting domain-containing protein [Bacteroidales bacterium]|nr:T9SS type A sorting domain-containing protein [Bacteroidales bacterium]